MVESLEKDMTENGRFFFGNMDQRSYVMSGGHPRTPFYQAFLKLAKSIWLLDRLTYSFDPKVNVFQVKKGNQF